MGFSDFAGTLQSDMLTNARGLFTDFAGPLGLVFGIAVLGLLFALVRRFMDQ